MKLIIIIIIRSNIMDVIKNKSDVEITITKTIRVFVSISTNTNSETIIYVRK